MHDHDDDDDDDDDDAVASPRAAAAAFASAAHTDHHDKHLRTVSMYYHYFGDAKVSGHLMAIYQR
jgi:hypothetical protein